MHEKREVQSTVEKKQGRRKINCRDAILQWEDGFDGKAISRLRFNWPRWHHIEVFFQIYLPYIIRSNFDYFL